ncbi:hypothetical protein ABOM_003013 [Aspergillus bombycis]|uniref:Protein kinase domain-containing protein n=1 Tax=Aspergillus bombycis TaxID=109264 RepID=A0A1F8AAV3_9EURO|nr:hypothetical protein ABOM_003013 [Aspergillus bombycis]OGM48836.1 hypothetical protein ABOM_003013 [Aspergillus bombycis]
MEIDLSAIEYVEHIRSSEWSCIFRTRWRDRDCILKVYHSIKPSHADPIDREVDIFKCESKAYIRLKARGLCDKGYIPDFYGLIKQINPVEWSPHLTKFLEDRLPPNAVLLEYVPDLQQIDLSTFSIDRIYRLRRILSEIHDAGVYHGDPYPRNIMVQQSSDRVLWIDFDRAQTFFQDSITDLQRQWLEGEIELVDYFVDALAADFKEGKLHRAWSAYYEGVYQGS